MIDSKKLFEVFRDCLMSKKDIVNRKADVGYVLIDGIINKYCLDKCKLKKHEEFIKDYIKELPDEFAEGWSFLNLCCDKENNQWTSSQIVAEQLMVLAMGINKAQYLVPRTMWDMLPGRVPYIRFNKN